MYTVPITIIIPILNEAKNLKKLVLEIKKVKSEINAKYFELIFIDDNSTDETLSVLKKLKKKNNFLSFYIRNAAERDLSKSCIMGFDKSNYKNIIVMDGDLQHPPRFIKNLIQTFFENKADIVVGSRNLLIKRGYGLSWLRYISSIIIIYMINIFLENKTSDPLSGFFIFKKELYIKNKSKLFGKGYKILADLIFSSEKNLKIYDENILFNSRKSGKSKMNFKVLFNLIIFLSRSFFIKWKKKLT